MLKGLTIENLAIIDNLSLTLEEGLNIFTGETGAGKTIIIEALSLALGDRADSGLVRTGKDKATVTALFETNGNETFIKREINASGKANAFMNEKITSLSVLKETGNTLVDIHGQHEHQSLLNPDTHIDLVDRFAKIYSEQEKIGSLFTSLKELRKELEELKNSEKEAESQRELLQFQIDEITGAKLSEGEDERVEKERQFLLHFQKLSESLNEAYAELYDNEQAIIDRFKKVNLLLEGISGFDEKIKEYVKNAGDISANLEDLALNLRKFRDEREYDPQKLEFLTDRVDLIQKLKKKYNTDIKGIIEYKVSAEKKLNDISSCKEKINNMEEDIKKLQAQYDKFAQELSRKRKAAAKKLEEKIEAELALLEMKKTQFNVRITPCEPGMKGIDSIEFLISPNPGEELRPLAKIASGGEISRIMLSLKSTLGDVDNIPVMVFDEIDLGIGGKTASSVGEKMKELAKKKQIICITHLAQIAACGNAHFKVEKTISGGRTKTQVIRLKKDERVQELARMISGDKITPTSLKHARELLTN